MFRGFGDLQMDRIIWFYKINTQNLTNRRYTIGTGWLVPIIAGRFSGGIRSILTDTGGGCATQWHLGVHDLTSNRY